ncbi:hypothetical protein HC928_07975 [bacterium]|nr:hypothetical protein [bacterium]
MHPPEKPRNVSYFIDRRNYSRNFLKLLQDDRIIDIVADTEATYGTGKTTILSDLYETVQQAGGHHPMWLSLNLYSAWYMTPALAEREKAQHDRKLRYSLPILIQNYISYHRLLVELAGSLHLASDAEASLNRLSLDRLHAALPEVGVQVEGTVEQWRKLLDRPSAGGPPQPGTLSEPQAEALIEETVQAITGYVLSRYNDSYGQQRNVLFADDYCWISDQRIGTWVITGLAQQMKNTVLIVSHSENVAPDERLDHLLNTETRSIQPLFLTNFTPEEVGEYLEKRLPRYVDAHPNLPDAAYYFSEGHAQTVCLLADLLEYADTSRIPDFAQLIDITSQSPAQLIRHLARHLLEKTNPAWLREALEIGHWHAASTAC